MGTTREMIQGWLERKAEDSDFTHMLVVCDTFDYEDYPVYVSQGEDVREVSKEYDGRNMQKIMEVYSYSHDLNSQLNERRAFHYD